MSSIDEILNRIDLVLRRNRKTEWTYIICTVVLFAVGIACIVMALVTGNYVWSTPSVITTGLLYKPLREIKTIRQENIALATAPMLIQQLPRAQAAAEIQRLLQRLYGEKQ
jgi:hypothetical protein